MEPNEKTPPEEDMKATARYRSLREKLMSLGDRMGLKEGPDGSEAHENAIIEKLSMMVDELRMVQEKEAEQMTEVAMRDYGLPVTAKAMLKSQALRDRASFSLMFPSKPQAEKIPMADKAALMSNLSPPSRPEIVAAGVPDQLSYEELVDEEALKLMESTGRDYATSVILAKDKARARVIKALNIQRG